MTKEPPDRLLIRIGDDHMDLTAVPVAIPIAGVAGGWTLAFWFVWLIYRGRVIPVSWVEAMRAQDKITEADLRERLNESNKTVRIQREQLALLTAEERKTVMQVISALPIPDEDAEPQDTT